MIIGYQISGYDNNSYMTGSCEKLFPEVNVPKCERCGYRTDFRYTNKDFILKRKTLDFSSTYDGITIVSLKFKELPRIPNVFQFYVIGNIIEYNAGLKENFCEACGQYESIVAPSMKRENITEQLSDGFYQSDLWFASGNEKSPIIIISPTTREKFKTEKFKNICFAKIEK